MISGTKNFTKTSFALNSLSQPGNRNILITSSNFPQGSASANYLNLFCRGVILSGRKIEVYLLKGFFLGGRKTNDSRKNMTKYGVKYTYLNFVNRPSNKVFKLFGDIYALLCLTCLLFSLLPHRKSTTIFAYNNELYHSLLLTSFCKTAGIRMVTFVPEYYDISEFSGSITKKFRWYGFLVNFYYLNRLSSKLIVFSNFIKSRYTEKKYSENRIFVQPNLTDFEFWNSPVQENIYTIGYSGTLYKKDGIEDLLTAICILKKRKIECKTLIVGDVVNEKSILPKLKSFCEAMGIEKDVTFTGLIPINEVRECLHKCMILAITRPNIIQTLAGFPTKLGEYFACGKIILSTNIGDVLCYFHDRQEIVFAEAGNPHSIADNLEWIINNSENIKMIAQNGYIKANGIFNYKEKVSSIMKFVERTN